MPDFCIGISPVISPYGCSRGRTTMYGGINGIIKNASTRQTGFAFHTRFLEEKYLVIERDTLTFREESA
jgi:hypothetical protein